MEVIDVYWSFRSPYSYLVTPDLVKLEQDYDVDLKLKVVLPIAVRSKSTLFSASNRKPAMYIVMDSLRRAQFLGMPMIFPPKPDPVVQNYETLEVAEEQPLIMRLVKLGVEAQRRGQGIAFAKEVSAVIFGGTDNWDQGDHLTKAAEAAGLDLSHMEASIENGDHLTEIERNHADLDAAGHWGVPTMVVRGEPFFGQDRVGTLRWRLDQYGLGRDKNNYRADQV
jgi:2-hydroxychromene-2-carboxylate isomerase